MTDRIPHRGGGGSQVNYPPLLNDILASLHLHTLSYLTMDEKAGRQVRATAEKRLVEAVQQLSSAHEQSLKAQSV